jgi:hypothetical protein
MRILLAMALLLGCPANPGPEEFAAAWLRSLAQGHAAQAYEQLCPSAQGQIASLATRFTKEDPIQFLQRLAGRYGGIDAVEVLRRSETEVDLAVVTAAAKLPLTLKRRHGAWCVALPANYSQ